VLAHSYTFLIVDLLAVSELMFRNERNPRLTSALLDFIELYLSLVVMPLFFSVIQDFVVFIHQWKQLSQKQRQFSLVQHYKYVGKEFRSKSLNEVLLSDFWLVVDIVSEVSDC